MSDPTEFATAGRALRDRAEPRLDATIPARADPRPDATAPGDDPRLGAGPATGAGAGPHALRREDGHPLPQTPRREAGGEPFDAALAPAGDAGFDGGADPPPPPPADTATLPRHDLPYLPDLSEARQAQATPASSAVLYLMALVLAAGLIWASVARVEEITKADARVIPAGREQVISSLEGGILAQLLVSEGAIVERDQPLARLDPTRSRSQYREGLSRALALKGSIARLRAEARGGSPSYPPEVAAVSKIVRDENATFDARRRTLSESLVGLKRNQNLLMGEIESARRLLAKGLYSKVELGRLERQWNEIQIQIDERQNRFRADANQELVKLEAELAQVKENLDARYDTFQRTTIKSPIRGVVKNIRAVTIGGTVSPAAPIMEIIPLDGQVLFEARLKPSDAGFVRAGLPAEIKLTAFEYSIFGDLNGTVQSIGPDTMRDDPRAQQQPETAYYRMIVVSDRTTMRAGSKELPILPGMIGTVEVRTGQKTVLDYLLKPMFKAREALRER